MSATQSRGFFQRLLFWRSPRPEGKAVPEDGGREALEADRENEARRRIRERMENIESRISGTLNLKKDDAALDLSSIPELEEPEASAGPAGGRDEEDGLIFVEDAGEEAGGVDATLRRFALVNLEHPVSAALFKLVMRRQAAKLLGGQEADPDAALTFLTAEDGFHPESGPPPTPEEILRGDLKLAAVPEAHARLNALLADENARVEDIASVIGLDPGLSGALLKMVNSAFHGRTMRAAAGRFPGKVGSLARAVTIVGEAQLGNLALAVSILPLFQRLPREVVDVRSFWRHSLAAAIFARALARRVGGRDPEGAFLAGLLHDVGRLAAYKRIPARCLDVLALARGERIPLYAAERRVLGWDHADLGGLLLEKWRYPEALARAVALHHNAEAAAGEYECALIHLADVLANALDRGSSGERLTPPVVPDAWDAVGLDAKGLEEVVAAADAEFEAVFQSLRPAEEPPA